MSSVKEEKDKMSSAASLNPKKPTTIVQFYSKSKDVNDLRTLGNEPPLTDAEDIGSQNWRRVLSNFYPTEIAVRGKAYPSMEHYFHAMKALCSSRPEYAREFEVGGSIGSKTPLEAKRAGGKAGFSKVAATLDVHRWIGVRDKAVARALKARAISDPLLVKILLITRERRLYLLHFERGGAKSYWGGSIQKATGKRVGKNRLGELLMMLREKLFQGQEKRKEEDAVPGPGQAIGSVEDAGEPIDRLIVVGEPVKQPTKVVKRDVWETASKKRKI